jgi:hypothetical protein
MSRYLLDERRKLVYCESGMVVEPNRLRALDDVDAALFQPLPKLQVLSNPNQSNQ